MPLYDITNCQSIGNRISIPKLQKLLDCVPCDKIGTWVDVWAIPHCPPEHFNIMRSDTLWICENLGHSLGHSYLVDSQIRIRRNDGTTREIDALSR